MDLRQLRYFVRVAEQGSISAAASGLFVAQSAVSRQMRLLEEELGGALFFRSAQGVKLNAGGQLLLERAKFILAQVDAAITDVSARAMEVLGTARFALPASLARPLTVPIAIAFQKRYPLAHLVIVESSSDEIVERLQAGSLDVGIITSDEEPRWLHGRHLTQERTVLLCRRGTPPAALSSVAPEDLLTMPIIASPGVVKLFARKFGELHPAVQIHSEDAALKLCRMSRGYALVPESSVHNSRAFDGLVVVPVRRFQLGRWIVSARDRPISTSARALRMTVEDVALAWAKDSQPSTHSASQARKSKPKRG